MAEPRTPSDRAMLWGYWRERLAGAVRGVPDDPQCGLWKAKCFGRWVGVQIDLVQDIDPDTGELVSDEKLVAFVGPDSFYDRKYVDDIWLRCASHPVTADEFERLQRAPEVSDLSREVIV